MVFTCFDASIDRSGHASINAADLYRRFMLPNHIYSLSGVAYTWLKLNSQILSYMRGVKPRAQAWYIHVGVMKASRYVPGPLQQSQVPTQVGASEL